MPLQSSEQAVVETEFNCTKCGACCRSIPDNVLKLFNLPKASSGGCGHLKQDNTCEIYLTRPDVCNTKTMWNKVYHTSLTWEEYCKLSEEICKILINNESEKANVDKSN